MAKYKLGIVVGSNRRDSLNRKLAEALAKLSRKMNHFEPDVMATVVLVLICLVQGVQSLGDFISRRLDKRNRNS